jgi:hypothetical protein
MVVRGIKRVALQICDLDEAMAQLAQLLETTCQR